MVIKAISDNDRLSQQQLRILLFMEASIVVYCLLFTYVGFITAAGLVLGWMTGCRRVHHLGM